MQKYFNSANNLVKNAWVYRAHLTPLSKRLRDKGYRSDSSNTIALFAVPRSGSTWLASLLHKTPHSAIVDEPLWQGPYRSDLENTSTAFSKLQQIKELGFHFFENFDKEDQRPEALIFFRELFDLQIVHPDIFSETSLESLKQADNFIFKFNYAGLMSPWLAHHFNFKSIVLHRHPCAVVASQLKHPAFAELLKCDKFVLPEGSSKGLYAKYFEQLTKATTPEGILACLWSLNFISTTKSSPTVTTTYERLIMYPNEELDRIFTKLGIEKPEFSIEEIKEASSSAIPGSVHPGTGQLDKWQHQLTSTQINTILQVLEDFGIDAYNKNLVPNYEKLILG